MLHGSRSSKTASFLRRSTRLDWAWARESCSGRPVAEIRLHQRAARRRPESARQARCCPEDRSRTTAFINAQLGVLGGDLILVSRAWQGSRAEDRLRKSAFINARLGVLGEDLDLHIDSQRGYMRLRLTNPKGDRSSRFTPHVLR